MGTRSWNENLEKYSVGQAVFVSAGYFDSGGSEDKKYSDCFEFKEDTLLEGNILSLHKSSVRVKFKIDHSTSTVKYGDIVKITDQNRHLIYDDAEDETDTQVLNGSGDSPVYNDVFLGNVTTTKVDSLNIFQDDSIDNIEPTRVTDSGTDSSFDIDAETLDKVFNSTINSTVDATAPDQVDEITSNTPTDLDSTVDATAPDQVDENAFNTVAPTDSGTTYKLQANGKTLFIAVPVPNTVKVHNIPMKPGQQKFLISSVFIQRAENWAEFDEDKHCRGAYIVWDKTQSKPTKKPLSIPVTAASNPSQTEFTSVKESKRGRKRKINESGWEQRRKKRARDSGQSYSPYKSYRGRERSSSRSLGEPCSSCRLECNSRVTELQRKKLFNYYWDLQDSEKQRQFISNSIKSTEPKRNRLRKGDESKKRTQTLSYFLGDTKVCQKMFLNTFDISRKVSRTAIEKRSEGNLVTGDMRGKTQSNIKYNPEMISRIKSHIKSFPVMESHYSRESSKRQYLASNLNIRKMYELFTKENGNLVEEHFYRKVFNESFNLGFHQPKKDQCDVCIEYKNAIDKKKLEAKYLEHQKSKQNARNLKTKMKEMASQNKSLVVAAFDLQKVLSVPYGEHSDFFYKRKLSVYDLTITNLDTRQVSCYVWDQTVAKRGSNEISSCLNKFINQLPDDTKEVFLFADNCSGQNKNRFLNQMLAISSIQRKIIINLVFLEKGHTQNINDTAHSVIEKAKNGVNIHHPHQWITLIESACRKNPYKVHLMSQEEFLNYKTDVGTVFHPLIKKKTLDKSGKILKVSWLKIRHARFKPSTDDNIYMEFKYDLAAPDLYHLQQIQTIQLFSKFDWICCSTCSSFQTFSKQRKYCNTNSFSPLSQ